MRSSSFSSLINISFLVADACGSYGKEGKRGEGKRGEGNIDVKKERGRGNTICRILSSNSLSALSRPAWKGKGKKRGISEVKKKRSARLYPFYIYFR